MKDGIYHVNFSSSLGISGEGLAVVKSGAVNGGDPGYLYMGHFSASGQQLTGRLRIQRWNPAYQSVFGPLNNFELSLTGGVNRDTFNVSGGIPNQPGANITIAGRFLTAAA